VQIRPFEGESPLRQHSVSNIGVNLKSSSAYL